MKLVGMFLFVLVAATVVVDVSASKASAKCEKKPGFYYGPDSKGKMKCIKACDAVKNEVVLFGQTFPLQFYYIVGFIQCCIRSHSTIHYWTHKVDYLGPLQQ